MRCIVASSLTQDARRLTPGRAGGHSRQPYPQALQLLMSLARAEPMGQLAAQGDLATWPGAGTGRALSGQALSAQLLSAPPVPQARPRAVVAPPAPGSADVARPVGRRVRFSTAWAGLAIAAGWPLGLVLTIQAALTLRLIWSNTAFSDEALYLWAGRLELAHLLNGHSVPAFASYFSGSPVLYPPLGAIAAAIGGLAGARLLSLAMMLAATVMLHGITRRLFDRRAALFAAALFAAMAGTQYVGALATYDAMALCLLALATWLAVLAASQSGPRADRLAAAIALVMALANATKYASALFDPVVLCVAVLAAWQLRGRAAAVRTAAIIAVALTALLCAGLAVAGHLYLRGLVSTTLDRHTGTFSAVSLLMLSGKWLWIVAALGVLGLAAAATSGRGPAFTLLAAVMTAAIALAPAEQARIHTYTSLFKHDDYGAWFGCAVAGYAVAALSRVAPAEKATTAFRVGLLAAAVAFLPGIATASQQYGWPNSTALMAKMRAVIATHPGPILSDDDGDLLHFYLDRQVGKVPVVGTWYISYRGPGQAHPRHGMAGYADAISHRYFSVVMLEFVDNVAVDGQLERDLLASHRYRPVAGFQFRVGAAIRESMIFVREGSR
jgi:Dolichyl-phosphate-mannose-protein mannosyltransferase